MTKVGHTGFFSKGLAQSGIKVLVQQDLAISVGKRVKPSQAFHFAYQDNLKGYYDLALSAFRQFIVDFPESSMAPQVYYYLGECYGTAGQSKRGRAC